MPPAWGPTDGPGGAPPASRPGAAGPGGPPPGAAAENQAGREHKSELNTGELRSIVKKARWNVFMYLGIAAMMFAFALIPLPVPAPWDDETVLTDDIDGGVLHQELPYLFGMPIDGRDSTDVRLVVEVVPKKGGTFHAHVIEAHCGTNTITDELIEFEAAVARDESFDSTHRLYVDSTPGETYEMEFKLDPGSYCLVVEYQGVGQPLESLEVTASVYGLREIGGGLGGISLLWAIFGFIGAQRKGKILKERTSIRRGSISIEEEVMEETAQAIITAGPGGPPTADGAPIEDAYAALSAQPSPAPAQPAPAQQMPPASAPISTLNYIESGDGYYYILKDDNTFDPQPYVKQHDGTYVPFSG